MQVVILAGGFGTRISEETHLKPKPMIDIGGKPILWHIMKHYSSYGCDEFIICLGYKGYYIKEYFSNYYLHQSDVTFDLSNNDVTVHSNKAEPWKVTLVDTGPNTQTGGRLRRVKNYLKPETFCFTYGDGLADIDIKEELAFHRKSGTLATLAAVQVGGRFGKLSIEAERVTSFVEKPKGDGGWINGGFFILEPDAVDYIDGDDSIWEREPLQKLSQERQLSAYYHKGFWHPMDTLRDKNYLEDLAKSGNPPWNAV